MPIFRKKQKSNEQSAEKNKENADHKSMIKEPKKIKKKMKIGFGHKPKKEQQITDSKKQQEASQKEDQPPLVNTSTDKTELVQITDEKEQVDPFFEELTKTDDNKKEEKTKIEKKEEDWSATKRKAFYQRDMKGKSVFLEDTGEKLGVVFDALLDGEKNLIGYKIKDSKSDSVLSFPLDQFDEDKNGLIFIPSWYTKGLKTIEQLEFKDRITPELMWLITDNTISIEELYNIFIKHDDKIASYIQEASGLKEVLTSRLNILEKERKGLKEDLMDLTEKRLIKDIDRREFSEIVMEHRRKVNVLDINIKKCKDLLDRLHHTSFGLLSTNIKNYNENDIEKNQTDLFIPKNYDTIKNKDQRINDLYRDKYLNLKERYDTLQEGYNELKTAVEKLLNKDEL